jgi:hypothetical protein
VKRVLCLVAVLTVAVSSVAGAATAPVPANAKAARKILRADVTKLARDYAHKHYRAVCSDLTKRERKHLGGMSGCTRTISFINAFESIKKFTITGAKIAKNRARATVSLYVNGNKSHIVHAFTKWEGGAYRLDHESGW